MTKVSSPYLVAVAVKSTRIDVASVYVFGPPRHSVINDPVAEGSTFSIFNASRLKVRDLFRYLGKFLLNWVHSASCEVVII